MGAHLAGEHILVNGIAPGPFPTWMLSTGVGFGGETEGVDWDKVGRENPRGRVGTPQDVAGLTIFLASRAGAYVVGQVIALDGGVVAAS
jgi:NAD(P)-dependent dehydrogenase (short-subunit alcohol dehydrogenase family)